MLRWCGALPDGEIGFMNRSRFLFLPVVILTTVILTLWVDRAPGQEVALTPMEAKELARGYRAETLKIKPVVNDKNERIGRISAFIFGKDGNIYVVLAVGDFTGVGGPSHRHSLPQPQIGRSQRRHCAAGSKSCGTGKTAGFPRQPV